MKNKRGISIIIGYVILITIAISLSVLVFNWLRFYVAPETEETCPEGVSLIIQDYSCANQKLNITLKNKGLFNISGFVLRVHDRVGAKLGLYTLNKTGMPFAPGEEVTNEYAFADAKLGEISTGLTKITLIDVQPFLGKPGSEIYCERVSTQEVECLEGVPASGSPPSSLVSWWRFEGNADDEGDGNDGTNHGGTFPDVGKVEKTLSFTLGTNYVEIFDDVSLKSLDALAIELWIKDIPPMMGGTIFNKQGSYKLFVSSDNKIQADVGGISIESNDAISPNIWYHIVIIWDGSKLKMYVNNVLQSDIKDLQSISSTSNNLLIGTDAIGNLNFMGYIDELAIYDAALSEDDVQNHWNNGAGKIYW